jgi:tRNA pseudouridine-54 N-methylase
LIKEKAKNSKIFVLEEGGKNIDNTELGSDSVFVLGDHIGLPRTTERFVMRYGEKLSLAKQAYLAATCITILNYVIDRRMVS